MSKELENEVMENEEVVEETVESTITTKEAFKAIGHNAKVKAKETWTKAKPKLKKAAVVTGVVLGAAYLINKNSETPALEQKDEDWTDDEIVDGEAVVTETAESEPAETVTETNVTAE